MKSISQPFRRLREMPESLAALTCLFTVFGLLLFFLAVSPFGGWMYEDRPVSYPEFWRSGGGVLAVATASLLLLLGIAFYRAQRWVRLAVPLGFLALTGYSALRPDPSFPHEWLGALFWACLSYWYLNRKLNVVRYFSGRPSGENAAPNDGPAASVDNSNAPGGLIRSPLQIVAARPDDAATLTEIAFAAKRHWGYPGRWIESWRDLLTIPPEFIAKHETYAALLDGRIVGFYALGRKGDRLELLHMWVLPDVMGRGVGRSLFLHAIERTKASGCVELEIESDPNAEGFYRKLGARRVGSSISGMEEERRELPLLVFEIDRMGEQAD